MVVLACVWRATTKKVVNFLRERKKVHSQKNILTTPMSTYWIRGVDLPIIILFE